MTKLPVTGARAGLADALNRVAYGHERIVLQRRGKDVAVLISVDDMRLYERLLSEAEDRLDVQEARRVLADPADASLPYGRPRAIEGRPGSSPRHAVRRPRRRAR